MRKIIGSFVFLMAMTVAAGISQSAESRNGEWVGVIDNDSTSSCSVKKHSVSLNIVEGKGRLSFKVDETVWNFENVISDSDRIRFDSIFAFRGNSGTLRDGATISIRLSAADAYLSGNFSSVLRVHNCTGNIRLARKDTLEAKALLTGEDPEVLKLEQQAALLSGKQPASSKYKWDGEWVGKVTLEKGSDICRSNISVLSASVLKDEFRLQLKSKNKVHDISTKINSKGGFETYANLTVYGSWSAFDGIVTDEFRFKGQFNQNTVEGQLFKEFGEKQGFLCTGSLNFAKSGTIEAKALLTGEDPEVLKLEKQAAMLNRKQPVSSKYKWDGEWLGVMQESSPDECDFNKKLAKVYIKQNKLSIALQFDDEPYDFSGIIDGHGKFSVWKPVQVKYLQQNRTVSSHFNLKGQFTGNNFEASIGGSFATRGSCYGTVSLVRKGTIEETAFLTGRDPEVIRVEQQAAKLGAKGLLHRAAVIKKRQVDPSKPYDGSWVGIVKSDNEDECRVESKIKEVTIKNFAAEIKSSDGTTNATVSKSGRLSKWLNLNFFSFSAGTTDSANAKLEGKFAKDKFEGELSADLDGTLCTATVKLGPKGSIYAEALLTGKNPRILALQRQIAAAQAAPPANDNSAARAEAKEIAQQRAAEEKRLAQLKSQQAEARKKEEARIAELRQQQKAEQNKLTAQRQADEQRLAKLRTEQERSAKQREAESQRLAQQRQAENQRLAALRATEEKRLTEKRKAEERRIAELRAEQQRITEQQKQEAARLARLNAEADAKAKQLAALQTNQSAKPKSNPLANINFGTYHALVIGINNYKNLKPLKTAVTDANAIAEVLKEKYGFKVSKLINPSHEDILDKLDELRETLKFKDNLLIYYAGHGWLDNKSDQGYWLASNAKKKRRSRWISNSTLTDTLKAIESKHVMVVADSCYSGRLVRGLKIDTKDRNDPKYYQQMSRKKARVVITSGGLEPVEDGKGVHSPFARAFLQALNENDGVIDGSKLFHTIRRPVMVNANQTPQYSDVRRAGHDGGDSLFVRRK
ncbi:MAG: hypothetical protein HN731_07365 [Rhodospirillaceae bacterium]|nr:hypothetical protein [Rhodospirillaceae bacterium]MBT7954992.1 hypothetical protein [Rhodospirillaceae bacterium]